MTSETRGVLLALGVFVVEATALIAIVLGVWRSRRPLWLRWLVGATLYVAYAALASRWIPVVWSGMVIAVLAALGNVLLFGARSAAHRPIEWWVIAMKAWIALAAVPAFFLFVSRAIRRGVRAYRRTGAP